MSERKTVFRFFKLINNDIVFGEVNGVGDGSRLLITKPFSVECGQVMPYMSQHTGSALEGIEIHQMNILWGVPLEDFPEIFKVYKDALSGITTEQKQPIVY